MKGLMRKKRFYAAWGKIYDFPSVRENLPQAIFLPQ